MTTCSNLVSKDRPSKGAVGFEIFIETGLDLAEASSLEIVYEKPGGDVGSWTADPESREVDGETAHGAVYVTQADDLDESGDWKLQVSVTLPSFSGRGKIVILRVLPILEAPAP